MSYIVKMPKLGLEMEQGTILEWYVEPGDEVSEGDLLAEVESEKSIGEVDAREDGILRRVYIEEEESVPPGTPIGILAVSDEDITDLEAEAEAELDTEAAKVAPTESETADTGGETATTAETGTAGTATSETTASSTGDGETDEIKASPRAQKRAEELDVDLSTVEGTGFDGAITEDDIETAAEDAPSDGVEQEGVRGGATETPVRSRYRRVVDIADPEVATDLIETVEAVRAAFERDVTMTDVLLVVASATLTEHPVVNGTYVESTHQLQSTQDIALVTDVDNDPLGGVISDVESHSLSGLVEARQKIDSDKRDVETEDATFTLANTAETGTDRLLVNPPGVAALEVDSAGQRAVPDKEGVKLQPLVTASLTYNTRALGRSEALAFLDGFFQQAGRASELVLDSYRGTE